MRGTTEATIRSEHTAPRPHDRAIACIDLDRFCENCAYNLRTLPVHRDAHTGIPVVRCPECGQFQSANDGATALKPWLDRATSLVLAGWILLIIFAFFMLGLGEGSISYATLDELTLPGGYERRQLGPGSTSFTWTGSYGPLEVETDYPMYGFFIALIVSVSLAMAFAGGMVVVVVFPHWPRLAGAGLLLVMPLVAAAIVAVVWYHEAPHLFRWGLPYTVAHLCAQTVGGLAGVVFGRPLARLGVRVFLPPSVRPRLAYLWLADNKPLPHVCTDSGSSREYINTRGRL
ncbi:MAG: hypothetical protein JSU63_21265 [Phycisphaerales bacterium]|nr:MAG: hypothetical protein JSU63_21265 [Phycisphaerales bacterium]